MRPFLVASLAAYLATVSLALIYRRRFFAIFAGVVLGIHTFSSTALEPSLARYGLPIELALWYLQLATFYYFFSFGRVLAPSTLFRVAVSWPASWFSAAAFLALPWAVTAALGFTAHWPFIPYAVAGFGFLQSSFTRKEKRKIWLDRADAGPLARYERRLRTLVTKLTSERPLRIVQITDPHLGPFMSERRLQDICQRAIDEQPDLILLTGDFLTVESQKSAEPLARALAPLSAMKGRVFACFGNHDHECPELVDDALRRADVELLIDRAVEVDLPWGPVQLIGADHRYRKREEALAALVLAHPRERGRLRLWLLHDPGAFHCIPEGEADLVFSGHTHGGHVGLLSLGLPHTIVSVATSMPDHGVWARGRDRLYVHRGTGHYGFPLRVGVPAEESVLEIYVEPASLLA
ncbi:MAG: phosphodiesterase [Myxococcaceae bacterium]|nr:phosphodiesterase [Myxococcaceae bacterium]